MHKLFLALLFLVLAGLSWFAVIAFFVWGIPIGLLFLSLAIWKFSEWFYKKIIPFNVASLLFIFPVMGLVAVLTSNQNLPVAYEAISFLLYYIIPIWVIINFYRKVRSL